MSLIQHQLATETDHNLCLLHYITSENVGIQIIQLHKLWCKALVLIIKDDNYEPHP